MERRLFLKSSGLFLLSSLALPRMLTEVLGAVALPSHPLLGTSTGNSKILVVIFQRGAMDGLSMVPALGDSHYNKTIRPSLYLEPGTNAESALNLDGFFALHPAMKDLMPFWNDGRLAVIHQVGSPDTTRSHFDAQDYMESGTPGVKSTDDGFLNRALLQMPAGKLTANQSSSLRAIALQPNLPRSLWGSSGAIAMNSIQAFAGGGAMVRSGSEGGFESMYDSAMDTALRGAGQETFAALKTLEKLPDAKSSAQYPKSPLAKRLEEIAKLIRGDVGMKLAVTECGGWDTHQRQGGAKGMLANNLKDLSQSIAAFANDLGPKMSEVCVVTMTEFGRTVKENGNGGTDHGHGSVMLALGGNVSGKKVISNWKNLAPENLFEGRDLPITTDFRDVWAELLSHQLGTREMAKIFPGYALKRKLNLFKV